MNSNIHYGFELNKGQNYAPRFWFSRIVFHTEIKSDDLMGIELEQ